MLQNSKMRTKDILKHVGDPVAVEKEMQSFRKAARTLSLKQPRMIDKFPKQWIAIHGGRVSARAKTIKSLMTQIDEKQLPRKSIIIRYIDHNQRTMIL